MQLTVKQLIWAIGVLLVAGVSAFWAMASSTSEGLRDDVSAIRTTLGALQGSDKDNAVNIRQAEIDFTKQVGILTLTVAQLNTKIDGLGIKMDRLGGQMDSMQKQISTRQVSAISPEAFVIALKKAGYDGKGIVFVPYEAGPSVSPQ